MNTRKRIFASERELHTAWTETAGAHLEAVDGTCVRIVYPGVARGSAGPDFRDAVVATSGGVVLRGDVELHLHSGDWRRHGHHLDHAYDGVVLHVVGGPCPDAVTVLACGQDVPTVSLGIPGWATGSVGLPCGGWGERHGDAAPRVLARLGVSRLLERAAGLAKDLAYEEPWVVLGRRIGRALGYLANADTAMKLAILLTSAGVPELRSIEDDDERCALIVGLAGLLPSQRRSAGLPVAGEAPHWESIWWNRRPSLEPMDVRLWTFNGLYPNNSPVRRAVALAALWPGLRRLAAALSTDGFNGADYLHMDAAVLERSCRVRGDGFWRRHYDFGLRTRESDLVGASKAREVVVNALLPYAGALAIAAGDAVSLSSMAHLLCRYPPSPDNAVTRHMRRQLAISTGVRNAAAQQGMLHLFQRFCIRGLCERCPLEETVLLEDVVSERTGMTVHVQ